MASEIDLKWNTFIGALQNRRTDVALVRLSTPINPNETPDNADKQLQNFMQLITPQLSEYIPD